MKKILLTLTLILALVGCAQKTPEDILKEYKTAFNNYNSAESLTAANKNSFTLTKKATESDTKVIETITSSVESEYYKEQDKYRTHFILFPQNNKTDVLYLEDTIYLNNDGYKFSYSDTLEGYLKQVKQYYLVSPLELTEEDVKSSKFVDNSGSNTYEFELSDVGAKKVIENSIYNYLGYRDDIFTLKKSSVTYKAIIKDGVIDQVLINGAIDGIYLDEFYSITFEEQASYSKFNETVIELPEDLETYKINTLEIGKTGTDYKIQGNADFVGYLTNEDYKKISDTLYTLKIGKNVSYSYNFEEKAHVFDYEGKTYKYFWEKDLGETEGCKFNYLEKTTLEGECTSEQIFELEACKNSFMYDMSMVGVSEYSLLTK